MRNAKGGLVPEGFKLGVLLCLLADVLSFWRPVYHLRSKMMMTIEFDSPFVAPPRRRPSILEQLDRIWPKPADDLHSPSSKIAGYGESSSLHRWGTATYEMGWKISIHIFAWRREKSLRRLCDSLLRAAYFGQEVPLYIHVDGEPLDLVVDYVEALKWPHGPKIVNLRRERLGMPDAIMSGWTPKGDDEYAILLEDDVEVSVGFFEYCLYCLSTLTYKRLGEGEAHGMMGCALYTPRVDEIGPAPNAWSPPPWNPTLAIGTRHRLFYFQLPCSWGAIYHAKYWREFLHYYALRRATPDFPLTPQSRSNEWFSSWKRILIELMLFRGWYLMYPSFPAQVSFSTNYFERGIHSVAEGLPAPVPNEIRKQGDRRFTVPLMTDFSFRASLPIPSIGFISNIPYVNLYHQKVPHRNALFLDVDQFLLEAVGGRDGPSAELGRIRNFVKGGELWSEDMIVSPVDDAFEHAIAEEKVPEEAEL